MKLLINRAESFSSKTAKVTLYSMLMIVDFK